MILMSSTWISIAVMPVSFGLRGEASSRSEKRRRLEPLSLLFIALSLQDYALLDWEGSTDDCHLLLVKGFFLDMASDASLLDLSVGELIS